MTLARHAAFDVRSVPTFLRQHDQLGLLVLVAVAAIVRIAVVDVDNIHNDEALWASYGLQAARTGDVLLLHVGVGLQHIPVFFWAVGLSVLGLGNTELAVRIPNLAASLLTVWSVWTVARDLAGVPAGWLAGLLFALSPFAVLYGATVFLDPFAMGLAMSGVALAFRGHPRLAGGLLALALGGKLLALAFVPLAAALAVLAITPFKWGRAVELLSAFALASGLLLGLMVLRTLAFDAPWFFSALVQGYDTGVASPAEWITRAGDWMAYAQLFFVSDALRIAVVAGSSWHW